MPPPERTCAFCFMTSAGVATAEAIISAIEEPTQFIMGLGSEGNAFRSSSLPFW